MSKGVGEGVGEGTLRQIQYEIGLWYTIAHFGMS